MFSCTLGLTSRLEHSQIYFKGIFILFLDLLTYSNRNKVGIETRILIWHKVQPCMANACHTLVGTWIDHLKCHSSKVRGCMVVR